MVRASKKEANKITGRRTDGNLRIKKKTFWKQMKGMKQVHVKNEEERLLAEKSEVCQRWKQCFGGVLN